MMPEGNVILVKTDSPFASSTASRIRSVVSFAQVATRQASGVIRAK